MFSSIGKYLKDLPDRSKLVLFTAIGVAIASTPTALAIVFVNSDRISYKKEGTEISFQGKAKQARAVANDTQYSTRELSKKLLNLQTELRELKNLADLDPDRLPEGIKSVESSFNDLVPTANQAFEDTEELNEIVESAIAHEE